MGKLFDFRNIGKKNNSGSSAIIEIVTEWLPWAYRVPGGPGEEDIYITYGKNLKVDHEYRIITVAGQEKAERIK